MKQPTQAERRRWSWAREVGCICCLLEDRVRGETGLTGTPPDVHHEVKGYRTGHRMTAFVCPWHHRGVIPLEVANAQPRAIEYMTSLMGPSLHWAPGAFRDSYGSDAFLVSVCDSEIAKREDSVI